MRVFLHKLKTASSFSPADWFLFIQAYFYLVKTRFLMWIFPSRLVEKALFKNSHGLKESSRLPVRSKEYLLKFFRLAWRYQGVTANCLPTSLAQQAFLAHYGFPTKIRIGIQKEDEKLKAHAWLESKTGETFGDGKGDRFNPLQSLEKENGS